MSSSSTVSSKGQITVPLDIRQRLGLKPGDRVEFVVEEGKTVMRPSRSGANRFKKYLGTRPAFKSMAGINAWVRDLREEEEDAKPNKPGKRPAR